MKNLKELTGEEIQDLADHAVKSRFGKTLEQMSSWNAEYSEMSGYERGFLRAIEKVISGDFVL